MKAIQNILMAFCLVLSTACSARNENAEIELVGSTPADEQIKSMLLMAQDTSVDFIRWDLVLKSNNQFSLDINYGESQPNTLGFINNGIRQHIEGKYEIQSTPGKENFKQVYQLSSKDFAYPVSLVKLTENLFHILNADNELMIGNGGWSYSLNKTNPVDAGTILISSPVENADSIQLVYDGRTPCQEIAVTYTEMNASSSCFKIKWRLILNRDPVTHLPTTCTIRNIVDNEPRDIAGNWQVIKGTPTNRNALIYKIEVPNLREPIFLLAGDNNVLFFLDANYEPMIGNKDFSFTMNKRL